MTNQSITGKQEIPKARRFFWLLVCIGILGLGFIVMSLLQAFAPQPQQIEAGLNIPAVSTSALTFREEPLILEGHGLVSPRSEITLSAQVNGEVISVHPQLVNGGRFSKGDLLVQLDPRPFEANLAEALASKNALEANLVYLEKQITRIRALSDNSFVPEENLDDVINRRDQAKANLLRQEATILTRELDLEHSRIIAPFDGFVQSETVDAGDIVSPGKELARFYANDTAEVVVSLNVTDAGFIPDLWHLNNSESRKAWVEVNYGDHRYQWNGVVDRVESDLDQTTRTVDVVVTIPNPTIPGILVEESNLAVELSPPPLLVGMYATANIEGMYIPNHFVLPVSAVHDNQIWIIEGESRLRIHPVDVIRQEGNNMVLLAPALPEGTKIIVSNIALVSDGMQVQVTESVQ